MTTTLQTPLGPIEFQPRDLRKWPRNAKPPTIDVSRLRGMTVHYAGGSIGSLYRGVSTLVGDEALVKRTIANHNARIDPETGRKTMSDVGYQLLLGRSGRVFDGRGLTAMNGANGPLRKDVRSQFPPGTTTSNPFFVSVFVCAGTDTGFKAMTDQQREILPRIYAYAIELLGIRNPIVNRHGDVRPTACPGPEVSADLPAVAAAWPPAPSCKVSNPAHPEWSCWPANKSKPSVGPGSSGDAVAYLHGVLRAYGYTAPATAVWASSTGNAVAAVQRSNKLPIDRVVGKTTWDIIDVMATKAK